MTQEKIKRIHRVYQWIPAVLLAVLGILLVCSCLDIYTSGPRPYSAEAIALRFRRIVIPVIICLIGTGGGCILDLALPSDVKHMKGSSRPKETMLRLRRKADVEPLEKETRFRLFVGFLTGTIFVILMLYPLFYFMDASHFSVSELNSDVIKAILIALIPAVAGLFLCWGCQYLINASYRREADYYKKAIADGHLISAPKTEQKAHKCHCKAIRNVRLIIILIAILLIILGVINGGAADVLKKAVAICTECIGLG